jgi:primary-amine oxidase
MLDEFIECERVVKNNPKYQAALRKRGITNFDLAMVDPWSAGNFGLEDEEGVRISRALSWIRKQPGDNGYAYPITGVIPIVDLNKMEVIKVEDYGMKPLPPNSGNYTAETVGDLRSNTKPLEIVQPEGHMISWQKWQIRFGFTPREGLVLHTVNYEDNGSLRPILYRASLSEMVVSYGDPTPIHNRQNAFDTGEYGIRMLANSLSLGCDCLGEIDAEMPDSNGNLNKHTGGDGLVSKIISTFY